MNARLLKFTLVIGLLAPPLANAADKIIELGLADSVVVQRSGDAVMPFRFNGGRPHVISINQSIPGFAAFKGNLVANLTAGDLTGKVVFDLFASPQVPQFVEVGIGTRVPVALAQAVIRAASKTAGLALTLTIESEDGQFGNTQRIYVGSLTQQARKPVPAETVRALLAPGLSLEEFHDLLRSDG